MFYCIREEIKLMLKNENNGAIVNTASVAGIRFPGRPGLRRKQAWRRRSDQIHSDGLREEQHHLQRGLPQALDTPLTEAAKEKIYAKIAELKAQGIDRFRIL